MKIKEAKSFLCGLAVNSNVYKGKDIKEEYQKVNDIILMLQRGDKFEKMWKRLKRNNKEVTFFDEMNYIEQKHFPKPVKDKDYFYVATSKDPHLKKVKFRKVKNK
jgi:hypothetical protein